jgi:hypothetical protein
MEAELHVSLYFQKIENRIFMFQNKSEKILDVSNDGIYKHAKYQCEILSTLGYTKMTNVWIWK